MTVIGGKSTFIRKYSPHEGERGVEKMAKGEMFIETGEEKFFFFFSKIYGNVNPIMTRSWNVAWRSILVYFFF